jgi:uncharacterized membrane protein (DUF485 family)
MEGKIGYYGEVNSWVWMILGRFRKWSIVSAAIGFLAFVIRWYFVIIQIWVAIGPNWYLIPPNFAWAYWAYFLDFLITPVLLLAQILATDFLSWRSFSSFAYVDPIGRKTPKQKLIERNLTYRKIGTNTMIFIVVLIVLVQLFFNIYLIVNYSAYAIAIYGTSVVTWGWTVGILVGCVVFLDVVISKCCFLLYCIAMYFYGVLPTLGLASKEMMMTDKDINHIYDIIVSHKMRSGKYNQLREINNDSDD